MNEARQRDLATDLPLQALQDQRMQFLSLWDRQMFFDGAPGQFVPESQRAIRQRHHAGREAFLNHFGDPGRTFDAELGRRLVEQPAFGLARHQRNQSGHGARWV